MPVVQGRQGVLSPVLVRLPPGSDSPGHHMKVPVTGRAQPRECRLYKLIVIDIFQQRADWYCDIQDRSVLARLLMALLPATKRENVVFKITR